MKKYSVIIVGLCLILVGCIRIATPESTIRPPNIQKNYETEIESYIAQLIPEEMELLTKENLDERFEMKSIDVDLDGETEWLAFYGLPHIERSYGFIVLQKNNGDWTLYFDQSFENSNYYIEDYFITDFDGDGYEDIIIEKGYGAAVKMANIYKLKDKPENLYTIQCNQMEIIENEGSTPTLAIWLDAAYDIHYIELIKWKDGAFTLATYDHPDYYEKLIYHYSKIAMQTTDSIYHYYYADILMKAGQYEKGLEKINYFLDEDKLPSDVYIMKGNFVKAKCYYGLGEIEEAELALNKAIISKPYYIDKLLEAEILLIDIYLQKNMIEEALNILDDNKDLFESFREEDYKRQMWLNTYTNKQDEIIKRQ